MNRPRNPKLHRNAKQSPSRKIPQRRSDPEYEMVVLSGDPEASGSSYVVRYRTLVACDVPAHWHPEDENVTVLAGEFYLGMGEEFSASSLRLFSPGSFAFIPRRQPHFTRYGRGAIVQVHGVGPLITNYL